MGKSKKYRAGKTATVGKKSLKIASYLLALTVTVFVCSVSFDFGQKVFKSDGMAAKGRGEDVVITVEDGATLSEVAALLYQNGLIENIAAFKVQTYLYEADIQAGTYTLNTEDDPEEIIQIISGLGDE